jgi:hypothetical protein
MKDVSISFFHYILYYAIICETPFQTNLSPVRCQTSFYFEAHVVLLISELKEGSSIELAIMTEFMEG